MIIQCLSFICGWFCFSPQKNQIFPSSRSSFNPKPASLVVFFRILVYFDKGILISCVGAGGVLGSVPKLGRAGVDTVLRFLASSSCICIYSSQSVVLGWQMTGDLTDVCLPVQSLAALLMTSVQSQYCQSNF